MRTVTLCAHAHRRGGALLGKLFEKLKTENSQLTPTKPSTEFEFRIRERRRATARRRFSAWMSRALRVRAHFFVIVSGVSCAGRRLACAPTVGIAKRFADINSTFPLFRRRDVLRSLSAEGGGKILPQTRTRASRRKSIMLSRSSTSQRLSQPGPRRPGPRAQVGLRKCYAGQ